MDMVIPWTKVWAVVITGLVGVFLALVLLIIFVSLFGKVFSGIGNKEKNKSKPADSPAVNVTKSAPAPAPAAVSAEDDNEVIAVISAAVAMMAEQDGKKYAVKSIKRTVNKRRQAGSVWGAAGQRENTRPF